MKFLQQLSTMVWKDLTLEYRNKEKISSMLIFALLVIIIFAFAFKPSRQTTLEVFPGMLWVAFTFSGMLGLNRSMLLEKENDCLLGLMLAPMDSAVIFFSKVFTNLLFMLMVEIISVPLFMILFDFSFQGSVIWLAIVILLGTFGFSAVGTFLAAVSSNTRTSEILLPLILFPIMVPLIIGAVQATAAIFSGQPAADFAGWLRLMAVFDIIFLVVPFILFDYVLEV